MLRAGKDADSRSAAHPVVLDVPPTIREQRVSRGGEASDMGHLAAGDQSESSLSRKAEQILKPLAGDFLDDSCGRRTGIDGGVLVPRGSEPVGGEGCRQRAADHPSEETAAGAAD